MQNQQENLVLLANHVGSTTLHIARYFGSKQ